MAKITIESKDLMDFNDAAVFLAVSRQSIYNMIEEERLHPIQFGKTRLLYVWELEQVKQART